MKVFVINAGSSSVKFRLYNMPSETLLCSGIAERIGAANAFIHCIIVVDNAEKTIMLHQPVADHADAVKQVVTLLSGKEHAVIKDVKEIGIVGHRIVHGGDYFQHATLVTSEVKEKIRELFPFAPLHNPVGLHCIEVAEQFFPSAKQVAVFDTAFHQSLPLRASRYALPQSYYEKDKIRVYGFHGISHKYVTEQARTYLQKDQAKMISIHLGNGCSIAAVKGGMSLDTSMGFSPLSGLVMGTRSGDLDPSVVLHLMTEARMDVKAIDTLLNKESGLKGLAGVSDMRDVHKAAAQGDAQAQFAIELYIYRIKKYIGAYAAVLNGLDALIFTAGVGEHDTVIREMVCKEMEHLSIYIDRELNSGKAAGIYAINTSNAITRILVIATNEELEIARQVFQL